MARKLKGYVATHFFSEPEFEWTADLAERIRAEAGLDELYVPQENGEINDKKNNDAIINDIAIYDADAAELRSSDVLIASLDGVEIDSGVAWEIGYFSALCEQGDRPRKIIGILTDMRQDGTGDNHLYRNLLVVGAVNKFGALVRTKDQVVEEIKKFCEAVE